ncbi:hypothetical protein [Streptomyces sp. NPDC054784]
MTAPTAEVPPPSRVSTSDGVVWSLRATTSDGAGLYAPESVSGAPVWALSTLPELARRGVRVTEVAS